MALRLKPDATFWAKVPIALPGGKLEVIEVEYLHMSQEEFKSYEMAKERTSDASAVMRIAKGWKGVEGEFNEENINALINNYHAAGRAIAQTFVEQLLQVKLGN